MSAGCERDPPGKRARLGPGPGPRQEGPGGSSSAGGSPATAVGNRGVCPGGPGLPGSELWGRLGAGGCALGVPGERRAAVPPAGRWGS